MSQKGELAKLLANRALAHLKRDDPSAALEDAYAATICEPAYEKAHVRVRVITQCWSAYTMSYVTHNLTYSFVKANIKIKDVEWFGMRHHSSEAHSCIMGSLCFRHRRWSTRSRP